MRYIKPLKGFRFTRNLGLFLFSSAVLSSQFVTTDNKAYGLETLKMPPSIILSSNKDVVKSSEVKNSKELVGVKNNKYSEKTTVSKSSLNNATINNEKIVSDNQSKVSTIQKPVLPASFLSSEENINQKDTSDNFTVKVVEAIPEEKITSSGKLMEERAILLNKSSNYKPVEEKIVVAKVQKEDNKDTSFKKSSSNSNVVLVPMLEVPEINFDNAKKTPSVKSSGNKKVTLHNNSEVSKKVIKEKCPPEWDWFSTPLVFEKDANGKMVIKAKKDAPKIALDNSKKSENDLNSVKCNSEKKSGQKKQNKNKTNSCSLKSIEAKPAVVEAPASPIIISTDKPVVKENKNNKNVEVKQVVEENKMVKIVEQTKRKPLFEEATKKMAKIKKMHEQDKRNQELFYSAKAFRSESMIKMNKLVSDMIKRIETKSSVKNNEEIKNQVVPQAPPTIDSNSSNSSTQSDNINNSNVKDGNMTFKAFTTKYARVHSSNHAR